MTTKLPALVFLGPNHRLDSMHHVDPGAAQRLFGYRRCYRLVDTFHDAASVQCNCLRTELPVEARALQSGALGTPDRNHTCPACSGAGAMGCDGLGLACCPRCAGMGERKANREPADHAFPGSLRADGSAGRGGK